MGKVPLETIPPQLERPQLQRKMVGAWFDCARWSFGVVVLNRQGYTGFLIFRGLKLAPYDGIRLMELGSI